MRKIGLIPRLSRDLGLTGVLGLDLVTQPSLKLMVLRQDLGLQHTCGCPRLGHAILVVGVVTELVVWVPVEVCASCCLQGQIAPRPRRKAALKREELLKHDPLAPVKVKDPHVKHGDVSTCR